MKVESVLKSKGSQVATTRPDAKVATVVQRLRLDRIGALVVSDDGVHVLGLISERDIVYGMAEHGAELMTMRVSDLMSRGGITCTPDDSIRRVMADMTRRRVRHIPVVEGGELKGIISIGDVVKNRIDEVNLEASVLRDTYLAGG